MTTDITVRVNGRYRAHVTLDSEPTVIVDGSNSNEPEKRTFYVPHGTTHTALITEEAQNPDGTWPSDIEAENDKMKASKK